MNLDFQDMYIFLKKLLFSRWHPFIQILVICWFDSLAEFIIHNFMKLLISWPFSYYFQNTFFIIRNQDVLQLHSPLFYQQMQDTMPFCLQFWCDIFPVDLVTSNDILQLFCTAVKSSNTYVHVRDRCCRSMKLLDI